MIMNKSGFIALTSILIIAAVILAISVSVPLLAIEEGKSALSFKKGRETLKIAEGCIEEAMLRLRDNANYTGGSLTVGDGSCTITVSGTGVNRTIDVEASITTPVDYIRNIRVAVKRVGNSINVLTWQEME